jgi:hypothetical protein
MMGRYASIYRVCGRYRYWILHTAHTYIERLVEHKSHTATYRNSSFAFVANNITSN